MKRSTKNIIFVGNPVPEDLVVASKAHNVNIADNIAQNTVIKGLHKHYGQRLTVITVSSEKSQRSLDLGYYNAKILGLVFAVVYAFGVAAIVQIIEDFTIKTSNLGINITRIVLGFSVLGLVLLISDQSIDTRILKRNSYILSSEELKHTADWVYSQNSLNNSEQLLIERDDIFANPSNSMLFNHVTKNGALRFLTGSVDSIHTCLQYIYWDKSGNTPNEEGVYGNLSSCLKKRSDAGLTTTILIPKSVKPMYDKINTFGAKFIVYDN